MWLQARRARGTGAARRLAHVRIELDRRLHAGASRDGDNDRLLRAAIGFDFRRVSGRLPLVPQLADIVRETPRHATIQVRVWPIWPPRSARRWASGSGWPGPSTSRRAACFPSEHGPVLRLRRRHHGAHDARTSHRRGAGGSRGPSRLRPSESVFVSMSQLRLQHHVEGLRAGRAPDDAIDTAILRPLTRVTLREALRWWPPSSSAFRNVRLLADEGRPGLRAAAAPRRGPTGGAGRGDADRAHGEGHPDPWRDRGALCAHAASDSRRRRAARPALLSSRAPCTSRRRARRWRRRRRRRSRQPTRG